MVRDKMRLRAKQTYANHVLRSRGEDRWLLQRQRKDGGWTSEFATEIIALYNSSLYVGGDIDVVVFSYGPKDVQSRLRWLVDSGVDYLTQKAAIGMGGREKVTEYDSVQARRDLREISEYEEWEPQDQEDILDCLDNVENREYVLRNLPHACWDLGIGDLGMVTCTEVFYAQAALARLCEILDVEKE